MAEMELEHEDNDEVENNDNQEYFHYLIENEGIQYSTSPEEAFNIYQQLINIAIPYIGSLNKFSYSCKIY